MGEESIKLWLLSAGIEFILSLGVVVIWNWLVPDIFGLETITYWQALGLRLLLLCFTYRDSSSSSK